jgi:hypothetical protein
MELIWNDLELRTGGWNFLDIWLALDGHLWNSIWNFEGPL